MQLIILALLISFAHTNNITSNLPTIVTDTKSYNSASPIWLTSPYMRANNQAVISTKTGSSQYPFSSYTFIYSSPLPGVPNLAYGIQRYRGDDTFIQEFYEIRQTGRTATSFSVEIQIFGYTNIWILAVAYLAVDPTFPHHLNSFDNVPVNYTAGDIVNITSQVSTLRYYSNTINYTSQAAGNPFTQFTAPYSSNYIVIFMTSLWIRAYSSMPVQFHIYPQVLNQTHYKWNITLYHYVKITNVHFSQIIFNSDDVQASQKYFIVYSKWVTDINGGFLPIPIQFVDNFIMGITSFQAVQGRCAHQYQWQFANKTVDGVETFGVQILYSWAKFDRCGLSWCESTIFYMMTWQCGSGNPFFNLTTSNCQDACGGFTYEDPVTSQCKPCPNAKCYQCANNNSRDVCTHCASYLFYEIADSGCVCMPTYFETNSSCLACSYANEGCYNCSYSDGSNGTLPYNSSLFVCLECNITFDYFLSGNMCQKCALSNCLDCQNLTACGQCQPTYDYSDQQTCIDCLVTGCINCTAADANKCAKCNQTMGYYNNGTNNKCSSRCADGIVVSAEEGCDDNNTDSFDGCSPTCAIEAGFECSGSPSVCFFQANATLTIKSQKMESVICNHVTLEVQLDPKATLLDQSYIDWDNFISTTNTSMMVENSTMRSYSAGVVSVSYFMKQTLQGKSISLNANYSSLLANSSIFSKTTAPTLSFTVSTTPPATMACCDGYYYNSVAVRCDEICGDGRLFELDCDDGNTVDGDGCSSSCSIEIGFNCSGGSTTSVSVCNYTDSVDLYVLTAYKIPVSNSVNFTFSISPVSPFIALNNGSTNVTSMVSFIGVDVRVTDAYIDQDKKELVVAVDYGEHLQGKEVFMKISPPTGSLSMNANWRVQSTNQLAVVVYSEDDYGNLKVIAVAGSVMVGAYLSIGVATVLFRKFIGLELATLIQVGYLSLLQNKAISLYLQPVTDWSYVFGYNNLHLSPAPGQRYDSSYHLYGYQKVFGYTNNIMVAAAAVSYGVATILLISSVVAQKKRARRLRDGAALVGTDLAYALVIFIAPNVISSFCIQAREGVLFQRTVLWSKLALMGSVVMLLMAVFIHLATAERSSDVGTFLNRNGISIYMPFFFTIRLILITVLLFIHDSTESIVPIYSIMAIQLIYLLYILISRPYLRSLDYGRSLVIQFGVLYIVAMRYVETNLMEGTFEPESRLFSLVAGIQYLFYGIAIVLSVSSFIYHIFRKFSGNLVQIHADRGGEVNQLDNDSINKLQSDQSKRSRVEKEGPILNVQEIDAGDFSTPKTSVSTVSLDRQPVRGRRMRTRR